MGAFNLRQVISMRDSFEKLEEMRNMYIKSNETIFKQTTKMTLAVHLHAIEGVPHNDNFFNRLCAYTNFMA